MKRIGLLGAAGRMGRMVTTLLEQEYQDRAMPGASPARNDNWKGLLSSDVIIDFSSPDGMLTLLSTCSDIPPVVSGVTGWTPEQRSRLDTLAQGNSVLLAANFCTGVAVVRTILRQYAPVLQTLGYTPVIQEAHHCHKKDAPSGTALALAKDIAPDHPSSVQTHAVRAGEVIGDHRIDFFGPADQISLSHHAQDRSIFARGALEAALWLADHRRPAGLLSMDDYLKELMQTGGVS